MDKKYIVEKEYYDTVYYPTWVDPHEPLDNYTEMGQIYGRVDWVVQTCKLRGLKRILDVGCGQGHLSIVMALQGMDVTGIDLSHTIIEVARKKNKEYKAHVRFLERPLETYHPSVPYDAILVSHVIEHVIDPDLFVKRIHTMIRPMGTVFMTVPFKKDGHIGHRHFFTGDDIETLVKKYGGTFLQFLTLYEHMNELCLCYIV